MTRRLRPEDSEPGNALEYPWVIVLSDWSERPPRELIDRIGGAFRRTGEHEPVPTVLIVDDLGSADAEHQMLLRDLTEAGGTVLTTETEEEIATVRNDPLGFAATQFLSMQTGPAAASALPASGPSEPDGYKELGKAVTRLSPEALEEVIKGRLADD